MPDKSNKRPRETTSDASSDSSLLSAPRAKRERLRNPTEEEFDDAESLLWQNNCLINAICQAVHGRNANMSELLTIRFNLGNLGDMMVADPPTIYAIRNVLNINNEIVVRYPFGSRTPDERFVGADALLEIFHTGRDHFQFDCPNPDNYNRADREGRNDVDMKRS
jgi:hypothetical protein